MPSVRTLPEALATAAHGDAGYIFVGSATETRRSYADMYEASLGVRPPAPRVDRQLALIIGDSRILTTVRLDRRVTPSLYPRPRPAICPATHRHRGDLNSRARAVSRRPDSLRMSRR